MKKSNKELGEQAKLETNTRRTGAFSVQLCITLLVQ